MAALHVVRIDLELGFRIYVCTVAQQQVVVLLERLRALRILRHIDSPAENTRPAVGGQSFEKLVAGTIRCDVFDIRSKIQMLLLSGNRKPVGVVFGTAPFQQDGLLVAHQAGTQSHRYAVQHGIALLARIACRNQRRTFVEPATFDHLDPRTAPYEDFTRAAGQVPLAGERTVIDYELRLASLFENKEVPPERCDRFTVTVEAALDRKRQLDTNPPGDIDERSVLHESRRQFGHRTAMAVREGIVIFSDQSGIFARSGGQRPEHHTVRQSRQMPCIAAETVEKFHAVHLPRQVIGRDAGMRRGEIVLPFFAEHPAQIGIVIPVAVPRPFRRNPQ